MNYSLLIWLLGCLCILVFPAYLFVCTKVIAYAYHCGKRQYDLDFKGAPINGIKDERKA